MHDPMPYGKIAINFDVLNIADNLGKSDSIIKTSIRKKVKQILQDHESIKEAKKYIKSNPLIDEYGHTIIKTHFRSNLIKYGKRQPIEKFIGKDFSQLVKMIHKVADINIQYQMFDHLRSFKNPSDSFSVSGIESFNEKRNKKNLPPIKNIRLVESSTKRFPLGERLDTSHKWMEATEGTNLYFVIYKNNETGQHLITKDSSVPFGDAFKLLKAGLPLAEDKEGYTFFTLSPGDLVYVPEDKEELVLPDIMDHTRIYKCVSFSKRDCFFIQASCSLPLLNKKEFTSSNKDQKSIDGIMIKSHCIKLNIDRLGNLK